MSKKTNNETLETSQDAAAVTEVTQPEQTPEASSGPSDLVKELTEKCEVMLTAKTRDELAEMVKQIPADCHYGAGAVGRDAIRGVYVLKIHLI